MLKFSNGKVLSIIGECTRCLKQSRERQSGPIAALSACSQGEDGALNGRMSWLYQDKEKVGSEVGISDRDTVHQFKGKTQIF